MTRIVFCERPGRIASRLTSVDAAAARHVGREVLLLAPGSRTGASCSANQRAAPVAPGVPGTRFGQLVGEVGGERRGGVLVEGRRQVRGGWSAAGRATLKASTRSGRPTRSQVPR